MASRVFPCDPGSPTAVRSRSWGALLTVAHAHGKSFRLPEDGAVAAHVLSVNVLSVGRGDVARVFPHGDRAPRPVAHETGKTDAVSGDREGDAAHGPRGIELAIGAESL